jgi:AcrR family transcriptional regulator
MSSILAASIGGELMTDQAKAEVTRQTIIEAAADLFTEVGYGSTGLTGIINRAGLSKGAFYYHFKTKESVAAAIIDQAMTKKRDALLQISSSASPALENLIRATFVVNGMTEHDKFVRAGHRLRQALTQVSSAAAATYAQQPLVLVSMVENAIAEGDLFDDLDADAVTQTLQAGMLGTRLLSDATGDDVFARLAQVWTVILRGIVPPQSLPYFQQFMTRVAHCRAGWV